MQGAINGYPTKEHDGYVFATDALYNAISDGHGGIIDEDVDNQIAFYFDEETFNSKTAEELYEIFKNQ